MKSVLDVLTLSTDYLRKKGIASPRRQAEELLCDALSLNRLKLYLDFERPLNESEINICRERLLRRANREPLQYIHGQVEFYNCQIEVNPSVLIPRQETEILVDKIVQRLSQENLKGKVLWDICCGSGCIGIALKKRFPELDVTLSDISSDAVRVARRNAQLNQVSVRILEGDLFQPFGSEKAHYIVSNPPYISEDEYLTLDKEVKDFEPKLALVGGVEGTEVYEKIAHSLFSYLEPEFKVWFEIGYLQGERMLEIFKNWLKGKQIVENDWSGNNRFFFLENE